MRPLAWLLLIALLGAAALVGPGRDYGEYAVWWLTNSDFIGFRIARAVEEQDNLKGFRSRVTRQSKNGDGK